MASRKKLAGRYRLLDRADGDPAGSAWRAKDELHDRFVTVRHLSATCPFDAAHSDRARAKAIRDARVAIPLRHPHAVVVHDVFELDATPYVITEYLAARTLTEVIAQRGGLAPGGVAELGAQLASALAAAHAQGISHRGISPDRVLVTSDGTAKIADFGLGPGAFVAPEVAAGATASFPADVYSLGATLHAALDGAPAGDPVVDAVLRLMRPQPSARPTMAEAERMFAGLTTPRQPVDASANRARFVLAAAALVVLLGAVAAARRPG